jgi:hypothetical protein
MGLFDYVKCSGREFVCSEGHSLADMEFQTKDLGCSMGNAEIGGVGSSLVFDSGGYEYGALRRPLLGVVNVYTACMKCPAFVQAKSHNLCDCWVEFEVEFVDDVVRAVKRVSPSTADFLKSAASAEYLKGAHGPMPYPEAQALHCSWGKPCDCGANR